MSTTLCRVVIMMRLSMGHPVYVSTMRLTKRQINEESFATVVLILKSIGSTVLVF